MLRNRSFKLTFTAAVIVGIVHWALPVSVAEATLHAGFWLGYLLLVLFGYLAIREGQGLRDVFAYTLPFVAFWFALGILNFMLGRGEAPEDWSPELNRLALQGFVLATGIFLPVAFAASGLGAAVAGIVGRRHRASRRGA